MRVLLTRNGLQNASMRCQLEADGVEVAEIALIEQRQLEGCLDALELFLEDYQFQHVIFISPSSIEFGAEVVLNYLRRVSDNLETGQLFAVGRGTAMLLKAQFPEIGDVIFPQNAVGAKALMDMTEMENIQGQNFLIVTGMQGKPFLEKELLSRNAKAHRWECYERVKPQKLSEQIEFIMEKKIEVVFLHSAHAARHFAESISGSFSSFQSTLGDTMHAIVGASAIKQELLKLNWKGQIYQAKSPMPEDMLACFKINRELCV